MTGKAIRRADYPVQIQKSAQTYEALEVSEHEFRANIERDRVKRTHYVAELRTETMTVNMGPQHPSTHGVLRLVLELDRRGHSVGDADDRLSPYGH